MEMMLRAAAAGGHMQIIPDKISNMFSSFGEEKVLIKGKINQIQVTDNLKERKLKDCAVKTCVQLTSSHSESYYRREN